MKNCKALFILCGLLVGITSFASAEEKTPPSHRVVARIAGDAQAVNIQGNYLYVAYNNEFTAIDISDIASPVTVDFIPTSKEILDIEIAGDLAYVGLNYGLWVIDISDPTNLTTVATYDDLPVWRIELDGNYAYTAQAYHMRVWDISDPTDIQEIANYEALPNPFSGLNDIEKRNDVVFVTSSIPSKTWVLDVSDPTNPSEIAIWTGAGREQIAVNHHIFYQSSTGCSSTCRMVFGTWDISDLTNPVLLATDQQVVEFDSFTEALVVDEMYAYVGFTDGLLIYKIGNPNILNDPEVLTDLPVIKQVVLSKEHVFAVSLGTIYILERSPLHELYLPVMEHIFLCNSINCNISTM